MSEATLRQVGRMIKENKEFEARQGLPRLIEHSRLPNTIKVRHGLKTTTYKLNYGDLDDRVYLSYSEPNGPKVLMHYDETTVKDCISKAWRHLAEHHIKL